MGCPATTSNGEPCSCTEDTQATARSIGRGGYEECIDQRGDYGGKRRSMAAYLVNVVDWSREANVYSEEAVYQFLCALAGDNQ